MSWGLITVLYEDKRVSPKALLCKTGLRRLS
jgi:hypothetical protein